jgi:hypothetical protein
MAWTATLSEMLVELRARGGYRRSTSLTDDVLVPFLNSGIAELHDLICKHSPDLLVTSKDLAVVADAATVALPSDFYKARRVDLVEGTTATRLRSFQLDEETYLDGATVWDTASVSMRPRYMLQAGNLRLVPTSSGAQTIRLWYLPHAKKLTSGLDSYTGFNGHEDLVYEHALRLCKARDRLPTVDHEAAIQRLEKRILFSLEGRDQSEPDYLPDHGRGVIG